MAFRLNRLKGVSRILPRFFHSSTVLLTNRPEKVLYFLPHFYFPYSYLGECQPKDCRGSTVAQLLFRFSTVAEAPEQFPPSVDLLAFLESILDELEGPYHCWLNKLEDRKDPFEKDGPFLVLAGVFTGDSLVSGSNDTIMFEGVKLLQRRHPDLCIFGFQFGSSACSVASQTHVVQTVMKEYITFPILLSNKAFSEVANGPCYLIFKDFKSPWQFHDMRTELGTVNKAIEELTVVESEDSLMGPNLKDAETKKPDVIKEPNLKGIETKKLDIIKEPYISFLRNLLLYFPGCISVDENDNRLFLSDSNHHRIIIFDGKGKILDCIGSSPGFEDGDFESAKLLRPASSVYHDAEDCLYFVDSENHAIRKADIGKRTVETLYPAFETDNKISTIWSWISNKLGMGREVALKSEELDSELSIFPWHLMKGENSLLVINPSFQTLWIMDAVSGKITEVVTGYQKIMEICGEEIMEKRSLLNQISQSLLQQRVDPGCSQEGLSYDRLLSSVSSFNNNIIFCDTVGQTIWKLDRGSEAMSEIRLSNFGILGLPYWYTCPMERVFVSGDATQRPGIDHFQTFTLLPGRCDIQVNVHIPEDRELAAPLQEGCIWRQTRGSAAEVSGSEDVAASAKKVGVAQQWFEELDNLAFSSAAEELGDEDKSQDNFHEDSRVPINCAVNISPGTSEVVIYAVLYLKLNRNWKYSGNPQEQKAKRIVEIINHQQGTGKLGRDACIQLMLESKRDMGEVIFMKPLHLRIGLEVQDHPKTAASKDIILTDSKIEVNVSLK